MTERRSSELEWRTRTPFLQPRPWKLTAATDSRYNRGQRRTHAPRTCALIAASMLVACDAGRDPSASRVATVDSAGVEVIHIAEQARAADDARWSLVEELRISGSDSSAYGALLFGRIASVTVDEPGNIYAVDPDAGAVLSFDRGGALLRRFARTGAGPGELGPGLPTILAHP